MDPLVILFGLGVGILVGLTGIGGGSLMTPLLILAIGTQPVVAIGTDLAYGAITKTVGGWQHLRRGNVDLRLSLWLAIGSAPGALLGVWTIDRLHESGGEGFDDVMLYALSGALLLAAVGVLVRSLFSPKSIAKERDHAVLEGRGRMVAVLSGLVLGFILGLTSVGSGALIGLLLILAFRLKPRRVVGTDVFHAAILMWVAGLAHLASGNVDLVLMANILIGSIPGVLVGAALLSRVPQAGLRPALGIVLLAAALGVLSKAGADLHPAIILGAPTLVGLGAWLLHHQRLRNRRARDGAVLTSTSTS
jgi:uncharacterized membrane protein YfcA